jgi:DNA-binding PadR family transcriptional regulator
MATDASTLYKLIILYMLDRVNSPMTNAQISEFVLEKGYTSYFTLQEVLNTLISDGFITEESYHSSTHYTITDSGRETINFFKYKISSSIVSDINLYLSDNKYELKEAVNNISEYYKASNGDYAVHCQVKENGHPIIDLTITVPDEQQADSMCGKWKDASPDIYEYIMTHLL